MNACPNIAGREIKRRVTFGYIGLLMTLLVASYVVLFNANLYFKGMIFITSMSMVIPFLEVYSETCIVNAFLGLKNMGQKYQKEHDRDYLKIQRKASFRIILKSIFISIIITVVFFYV
tara:strand:- start:2020 stop:2373 length:354 start_codon:yes stop_codon:yes gene_type:complete